MVLSLCGGSSRPSPFLASVERPCLAIRLWAVEYQNLEQKSKRPGRLCETLNSSAKQRFENQLLPMAIESEVIA